jgi:hypothetical protein
LLSLVLLASAGWAATKGPAKSQAAAWLRVEYGSLVDSRRLTHSGETVGAILARLGGRARPPDGDRSQDGLDHRLLDPVLEPYAFVLPDALDSIDPPHDPPFVDIGGLWDPGGDEPAWVELCRARRFLVESDGEGHLRVFLPSPELEALPFDDALPKLDPQSVSQGAWRAAWPSLRFVLAAERRRLAKGGANPPPLEVAVHAYRHLLSRSAVVVAGSAWSTRVTSTAAGEGSAPPLDLGALRSIVERGQTIEGARLEPDGRLRWLARDTDPDEKVSFSGRPPSLSDLAVAYRAVFHGGYGEPYMSLDRGPAPHVAEVNYGGRLRDTALGKVSLLSDVRFKTLSVGIDLLGEGKDARPAVRQSLGDFKTHLERFASDPAAGAVLNQQTRFWFYPDDVDVTLSGDGDVLAFRRVRMAAASERVEDASAKQADPAWTRAMISYLNERHGELTRVFPEIAALDESVRYLALFTWLKSARERGLPVPDLDVLLDETLPATPTPRRFPYLLSYDVLPPSGSEGNVDVYNRTAIGDALDRLEPRQGSLPPLRRFRRALAQLDRRVADQATMAKDMEAQLASPDPAAVDRLAYRAERLLTHARVLATLPAPDRAAVEARRKAAAGTRVFSVGIGGIDLGMSSVFARAASQSTRLSLGAAGSAAATPPPKPAAATGGAVRPRTAPADADPSQGPGPVLPDHGLGPAPARKEQSLEEGKGKITGRELPGRLVRRGTWKADGTRTFEWQETRESADGPEVRSRRRIAEPGAPTPLFERVEAGRFLSYRLTRNGETLRAAPAERTLPPRAFGRPDPVAPSTTVPEGVALLDLLPQEAADEGAEVPGVRVRIRAAPDRQLTADVPRPLLQRLVMGRDVDLVPDRPLAAFTPARQVLGDARTMMILQSRDETVPPWDGAGHSARPGEEDAARIARALTVWWGADPANAGAVAVVGTSVADSPGRWAATKLGGPASILDDAAPDPGGTQAAVLVSTASPSVLGRRLHEWAGRPGSKGRILAVISVGGPLRRDLPAALLAEGNLSAVGIADPGLIDPVAAREWAKAWVEQAKDAAAKGKRPEEIPGPFTWYY